MHAEQKMHFDAGYQTYLGLRRREVSRGLRGRVEPEGNSHTFSTCEKNGVSPSAQIKDPSHGASPIECPWLGRSRTLLSHRLTLAGRDKSSNS